MADPEEKKVPDTTNFKRNLFIYLTAVLRLQRAIFFSPKIVVSGTRCWMTGPVGGGL